MRTAAIPTASNTNESGESESVDATWLTVTDAVAINELDVAVIVAVPFATEVTRPADETVATDAADVAHVTVASGIADPTESFTVALNVTVSPNNVKLTVVGESVTEAAT